MTFCLDTIIIPPDNDNKIKNAVILLHGYGGDGKDISLLTLNWKRFLKNTVFLCPNGHEKCEINPIGFQWFDLSKDDDEYILKKSLEVYVFPLSITCSIETFSSNGSEDLFCNDSSFVVESEFPQDKRNNSDRIKNILKGDFKKFILLLYF